MVVKTGDWKCDLDAADMPRGHAMLIPAEMFLRSEDTS